MLEREKLLYELITDKKYPAMKFKEIAGLLQVPKTERAELKELLDHLVSKGQLVTDSKGRYVEPGSDQKVGIYSGTNRGFGFVTVEGEKSDYFIPEMDSLGALDKDKVQIELKTEKTGKRQEATVVKILERNFTEVIGTLQMNNDFGFVVPDNQKFGSDVFVAKGNAKGAVTGHKVVVKLLTYGDNKKNPEGRIVEILGHINDPGVDILSIVKAYGFSAEFPEDVQKQIEKIPDEVSPDQYKGRLDLRELQTVTIDGEDAKDLDDAITLIKNGKQYQLGVHIADVSAYVTEYSPLDQEALKRGTSVYLVDRVIPMLPHKLSNGICSLNAGTDRLALSCIMEIDNKGNVVGHQIAETVIHVDQRMSYTSVQKVLDEQTISNGQNITGEQKVADNQKVADDQKVVDNQKVANNQKVVNDQNIVDNQKVVNVKMESDMQKEQIQEESLKYKELIPMFLAMKELADILREKRRKRGSINFDFPESKIILAPNGTPLEIKPYERNAATEIIEDFMLAANETVAEDYFWQELPFVYRSHESPDSEKIQKLKVFLQNFGYTLHLSQDEIHPKELQKLLDSLEGTPEEAIISRLTLRSMKQARYTTDCDGHFGLSANYYCHFTSPIRRYPDLQIHRIIKENLCGGMKDNRVVHYNEILPDVAKQASLTERRADEAEREVEKLKKAEYMSRFIGDTFEGVISGVTAWGMYVELPNTVEGLIRVSDLSDDFYIFDEEHFQMIGEHSKRTYNLGQKLIVEVYRVDKVLRTVDFLPVFN